MKWRDWKQPEDNKKEKEKRWRKNTTHIKDILSWGTCQQEENKSVYLTFYLCSLFGLISLLPVSPLEPDCGSCCLEIFIVERLEEICRLTHLNFKQKMEN